MSLSVVFLDSGPLGRIVQRRGKNADSDACQDWLRGLIAAGVRVCVAEVNDYEVRRSLILDGATSSIARLDALVSAHGCYVPISTGAMREASALWASIRKQGLAPAPKEALDGDVILAAQVQILAVTEGISPSEIMIATGNSKHMHWLSQADEWQNIKP